MAVGDLLSDALFMPDLGENRRLADTYGDHDDFWREILLLLPALPLALGPDTERGLSDYLCFPGARFVPESSWKRRLARKAAELAAADWLIHTRSQIAADLVLARLQVMLSHPEAGVERPADDRLYREDRRLVRPDESYLFPRISDCLALLSELPASNSQLDLLEEIFAGRWPAALVTRPHRDRFSVVDRSIPCRWDALALHLLANGRLNEAGYRQAKAVVGPTLMNVCSLAGDAVRQHELWQNRRAGIEQGLKAGRFSGSKQEGKMLPGFQWNDRYTFGYSFHRPEHVETLQKWALREQELHFDAMSLTDEVDWEVGGGLTHLVLLALRQLERLALDRKTFTKEVRSYRLVQQLAEMLSNWKRGLSPSDETLLAEQLGGFRPDILEQALPYAADAKPAFLRALGWHDTLPLYAVLREHAWEPDAESAGQDEDTPATPHLDRPALLAALRQVKPEHRRRFADAMAVKPVSQFDHYPGNQPLRRYLMAVEALEGSNRVEIDKAMAKGAYFAIRAFGLLPVPDDAELRQRYLRLRQLLKDAAEYGQERRANTHKAVAIAMDHLAATTGYADGVRLEWSMEARFAEETRALGAPRQVEKWTLALNLDAESPQITVHKDGKLLASVPSALRKAPAYLDLKSHLDNHRAQMRRFRKVLEGYMAQGESLPLDQLQVLRRLPYGNALLHTLVLYSESGKLGLLHPTQDLLVDLEGRTFPLGISFRIAHVHDLFQAGQLAAWQRRIVAQQWVQPFKQVFRELYILTPAEIACGDHSLRFANHAVRGPIASRLLQSRNWLSARGENGMCSKVDRASGLVACFEFSGVYNYLGEEDGEPTSGAIRFATSVPRRRQPVSSVPLAQVPPLLLSETFRDADLTVSVAQVIRDDEFDEFEYFDNFEAFGELISAPDEDDRYFSTETVEHRAAVVTALVHALGLKGVRCEGRFAYVQGRRAQYRVHLATAAIHILPGNYLCIVPDKSASKNRTLYLPFAETDTRIGEILSKILLLVRDDQIKDESITEQIDAALETGTGTPD
ncbi:MAG: DUF4132 domain-containing protein [Rhodocyclaceae bacterium]|nr:DUF4132 domain-containing protein [Rhodocyclaceae bacterium]